ncbi:MAG: AMP-binding protein, partial [Candidatus Aminicenantes bacterium]|nr:AMP-binding protein [Candidatus Aminicenantes bacterium]
MEHIKKTIIAEYWLKKLSGELPEISLPLIIAGKKENIAQLHTLQFKINIPRELTGKLKKIAKNSDIGLFTLYLSALNIGLHKYTGIEDLLVGALPPAVDGKCGMDGNILFCRNRVAPYLTVKEVINQTKRELVDAVNYSEFSLDDILAELKIKNNNNTPGIFKVALIDEIRQRDIKLRHRFDMVFALSGSDKQMILAVEYTASPGAGEMVESFGRNLLHLLEGMADNPGQKIALLDAVNNEEKQHLLYDFNDTAAEYPRDKTIHRLFEEQAERTPDRIALFIGHVRPVSLSYKELNEQSHRLAGLLREKGVLSDNIAAIKIERSLEMIVGIMGILKAGGAYLPIDPDYPQERIDYMLKDSSAKILVTANEIASLSTACVFNSHHSSFIIHHSSHLAYIIYTSGTTGKPKGVLIEHKNVVRLLFNNRFQFDFNDRDVWSLFHSYSFDFSVWEMYGALLYG